MATLAEQLTDDSLLHLWKTGADFRIHSSESDDFTEVICLTI